ncbi:MAG TPA: DinB family protein [Puia sp.]
MSIVKLILSYTQYNHWANEKLVSWLTSLDRGLLYQQTPSSFPSLILTVEHMQQSHQFWLDVIAKKELIVPDETDAAALNFSLLLAASKLMLDTFGAYTEEDLLEEVASPDMFHSRYEFILHAINHNSYHRGQIVTICRRLGVVDNIPSMDYDVFLWERANPSG